MDYLAYYSEPPSGVDHPERDERIKLAVDANDVGVITLTFMKMINEGLAKDFVQCERDLRRLDLPVYLIAVPREFRPHGIEVRYADGQHAPFSLWVCLHGRAEATQKLTEIGVATFGQNMKNLETVGFLTNG
jgi:hypothetical protein